MKYVKKIILGFLVLVFFLHLGVTIFNYRSEYLTKFDANYWEMRYNKSQWVISNSKNSIGDDGLYAYVGWNYITGGDPTLLNAEIPPVGKYIIGIGEITFQNQNILILLVGLSCLGVLYLVNIRIFKDKLLSFIPVFLFSFDPLFSSQLRAPYLDTMYLLFLLLALLCTLQKRYVLSSLMLGLFAATKFPAGSLFLFAPIFTWVFLYDRKGFKKYLISLLLWPLVFLLSYTMYFVKGGSMIGFLGVQKWIVHFYQTGVKSSPGIVYPMILFGNWYTWFGGLQKVSEWNLLWPISFIGSVFAALPLAPQIILRSKRLKSKDEAIVLVLFWVISYLMFLSFTPVFPRYLLLLLPFMYNLCIWFLVRYAFPRFS